MSLLTVGGSLTSSMASSTVVTSSILQDRVIGVFMNSLYWHADDYQEVPTWQHRMAVAHGGQSIAAQGQFGFAQGWTKNPPFFHQFWTPDVADPGAVNSWVSVEGAGFTDYIFVTDNFSGPLNGTGSNPRVDGPVPEGGADDYVTEIKDAIDFIEANTTGVKRYWIYEGWADGATLFGEFTGVEITPGNFATWRGWTTDTFFYTAWFDNLVAALRVDLPGIASRINLIPVARSMVSTMETTPASTMASEDWFEDDAPHGTDTCYLHAAMVTYTAMFDEQAPTPDFTGASINSTFQTNYTAIAQNIATVVGV